VAVTDCFDSVAGTGVIGQNLAVVASLVVCTHTKTADDLQRSHQNSSACCCRWSGALQCLGANPALPVPAANSHLIAKFSPQIVAGSG